MFTDLPEALSLALVVNLKEELILAVPFFRKLAPETTISLITLLQCKIAVPDEVSCQACKLCWQS